MAVKRRHSSSKRNEEQAEKIDVSCEIVVSDDYDIKNPDNFPKDIEKIVCFDDLGNPDIGDRQEKEETDIKNMEENQNDYKKLAEKVEELNLLFQEKFRSFTQKLFSLENKIDSINSVREQEVNENILSDISEKMEEVMKKQDRNDRQVVQTLRENANFQLQVRQGMQRELDTYKKIESGEIFVPVLESLASVYIQYKFLLEKDMESSLKKSLILMFEEFEEILEDNGAEIVESKIGEKRKARLCKIMNKISTSDMKKHNTIARSVRKGVILGRQILCKEYVDVYIYDENLSEKNTYIEETVSDLDIPEVQEKFNEVI